MQRLKNFIGDLSTTRGKLKLTILVATVLLIVGAVGVGVLNATNSPQFCSSCHEMQPEYVTWQVSSHTNVTCVQCHVEPGFTNFMKHKVASLKQVYEHVTQTYPSPITMPHPIEGYVCEQCHDVKEIHPEGELVIPHEKHVNAEVECVECHRGVVHANIANRDVTTDGDWDAWTTQRGQKEVVHTNTAPSMEMCMSCHEKRQVDNSCATCHTEKGKPDTHQQASWAVEHGKLTGDNDLSQCAQCHGAEGNAKTVVEYSRESKFCSECHSQKPADHDGQWMLNHKETVAQTGLENCFTCHDREAVDKSDSPSNLNCNSCHKL